MRKLLVYAILLVVTLAAYANSLGIGMARDGRALVSNDERIRVASYESVTRILHTPYWWPPMDRLYRPVTTLSFLINYSILGNGSQPAGYHFINLVLHLLNVCLLFQLCCLLFRRTVPALAAAALWAVHPIHTEVVTNIAGRADLLAGISIFGGLLIYARMSESTGQRRMIAIAGLLALAALGVFSKENAAVLAGLMFLWDLSFGTMTKRGMLSRLPFYAAALIPLLLFAIIRRQVFSGLSLDETNILDNPLLGLGFLQSRFMALKVIGLYLWLLAFPISLSSDRSYNQIPVDRLGDPLAWLAVAVVIGLLAAAIVMYRRDRLLFWCAGFFAIAIFPTSNLPMQIGTIAAERFLYVPTAGFAIAVAALAFRWKPESRVAAILGAVVLLFAARTFARNPAWDSDLAISTADVQSAPNSFRMHTVYGESLYFQNPRAYLDAAVREQEAAWKILSGMPPAKTFTVTPAVLGMLYGLKGDLAGGLSTAGGRSYYESSLATLQAAAAASEVQQKAYDERQTRKGNPSPMLIQYGPINFYLGQAFIRLERFDEGLAYYRRGVAREPENPVAYDTVAQALFDRKDLDGTALTLLEKTLVLGLRPDAVASLRGVYEKLPDGACAVRRTNGVDLLDSTCPRLARDLCKAAAALEQIFLAGRKPDKAHEWRRAAAERYGCGTPTAPR